MGDTLLARRRPPEIRVPGEASLVSAPTRDAVRSSSESLHNHNRVKLITNNNASSPGASGEKDRVEELGVSPLAASPSRRRFLVPLGTSARSLPDVFTPSDDVSVNSPLKQSQPIPIPSSRPLNGANAGQMDSSARSKGSISSRRLPDVFEYELSTVKVESPGKPTACLPLSPTVDDARSSQVSSRSIHGRGKSIPRVNETDVVGSSPKTRTDDEHNALLSVWGSLEADYFAAKSANASSSSSTSPNKPARCCGLAPLESEVPCVSKPAGATSSSTTVVTGVDGKSSSRDSSEFRRSDKKDLLLQQHTVPKEADQRIAAFYPSPTSPHCSSSPTGKQSGLCKSCLKRHRATNQSPLVSPCDTKVHFDPACLDTPEAESTTARDETTAYYGLDSKHLDYELPCPGHGGSPAIQKDASPSSLSATTGEGRAGGQMKAASFRTGASLEKYCSGRHEPPPSPLRAHKSSRSSPDILPSLSASKNDSQRSAFPVTRAELLSDAWQQQQQQQRPYRRSAGTEVALIAQSLREEFRRSIRADGTNSSNALDGSRAAAQEFEFARSHPESFRV